MLRLRNERVFDAVCPVLADRVRDRGQPAVLECGDEVVEHGAGKAQLLVHGGGRRLAPLALRPGEAAAKASLPVALEVLAREGPHRLADRLGCRLEVVREVLRPLWVPPGARGAGEVVV